MEQIVTTVLEAIAGHDCEAVRRLLHPYLDWTGVDGVTLRGRNNVMAMLEHAGIASAPAAIELRDGQIYRWWSAPPAASQAAELFIPMSGL